MQIDEENDMFLEKVKDFSQDIEEKIKQTIEFGNEDAIRIHQPLIFFCFASTMLIAFTFQQSPPEDLFFWGGK